MKHIVELPAPAMINRPVHSMAVIVVVLFAFHFARLAGFSAGAITLALIAAVLAGASLGLRRALVIDSASHSVTNTVTFFSVPVRSHRIELPGMAWSCVRSDLPDLVIEVGAVSGETLEVKRFRNGYGGREDEAAEACTRLAQSLGLEDRGLASVPSRGTSK